jgi:hypothetical protein
MLMHEILLTRVGAPTDARPFFFNTLKPGSFRKAHDVPRDGVVWGNVRATWTLVLLFAIAAVLIICIIVWPLARSGLPTMEAASFVMSIAYFAIIGVGYLLIQVPFLQRFSVCLGHPTYTFAIILFSMICFTGIRSFVADRFPVARHPRVLVLPVVIGTVVLGLIWVDSADDGRDHPARAGPIHHRAADAGVSQRSADQRTNGLLGYAPHDTHSRWLA